MSLRRLLLTVLVGAFAWLLAGWWWEPIQSTVLRLPPGESCLVLGLSEDGLLIGAERTPETADWVVWKRTIPDGGRSEVWRTEGSRTRPPADVAFRLQAGGRWLFVSKMGTGSASDDAILDLRTGAVHPGRDEGMRWIDPTGTRLVTDDPAAGLRVNDLQSGQELGRISDDWIHAFSHDGALVAAETNGVLRVWRMTPSGPELTAIQTTVASPVSTRLGATNDQDFLGACRFTDDSRRFVVYGSHRIDLWDVDAATMVKSHRDPIVLSVSGDGARGYEPTGRVFDTVSNDTLVDPLGWQNDIEGIPIGPGGWFLSRRLAQSSWSGRGWPGAQFRIGPYTVSISSDDSLSSVGCDLVQADSGVRLHLPSWFLPSSQKPGGSREDWTIFTHPRSIAFHNAEGGFVRIIDLPPRSNDAARFATALALFAFPAWRLNRSRKPNRLQPPETCSPPERSGYSRGHCGLSSSFVCNFIGRPLSVNIGP